MSDLSHLIAEVSADRETGTEDAWWRDQIGDFALVDFGTDEDVNGGQDAADRRRILRVPKIERALIETARQMRDERALLETSLAQLQQTLDRLAAENARLREALYRCPPTSNPTLSPVQHVESIKVWWANWARPALNEAPDWRATSTKTEDGYNG